MRGAPASMAGPGSDARIRERAVTDAPTKGDAALSTTALLEAVARRDRNAYIALFRHFAPRVKSYLLRNGVQQSAAEELVQEVMLTVWHRAPLFDRRQAAAATWIYTIARNKRIDSFRREKFPEVDLQDPALVPAGGGGPHHEAGAAEESERLRCAMRELPPEQLELLSLHYFSDMSHGTIAGKLDLPLGTVKSRLRLGITRLRAMLDEELGPGR